MELYVLDSLLRSVDVIDVFISLIWTERYAELGDFELVTLSTSANQRRFVKNAKLMINKSKRIMRIETIEETFDLDNGPVMKIKGRELTAILDDRIAIKVVAGVVSPVWYITDNTPGDTMRYMFSRICVDGSVSADDIIPFINTSGGLYPIDTIPEPTDLIDWEQKPDTLYSGLKDVSDIYDLGFRLYKDPNTSNLYFEVYSGSDRTSQQTLLPPVIFSPDMENLQDTTELTDVSKYYNVIQVLYSHQVTPVGGGDPVDTVDWVTVSDPELADSTDAFERRVKILSITSIPDEVTDIAAFMIQAGVDELAKSRPIMAFDGEISQYSSYIYERDYYLGDLVETRGKNGSAGYMRVVEQIFAEDGSGERSYPTLTTKTFIQAGTWLAPKYDVEWITMGDTEFWDTQ